MLAEALGSVREQELIIPELEDTHELLNDWKVNARGLRSGIARRSTRTKVLVVSLIAFGVLACAGVVWQRRVWHRGPGAGVREGGLVSGYDHYGIEASNDHYGIEASNDHYGVEASDSNRLSQSQSQTQRDRSQVTAKIYWTKYPEMCLGVHNEFKTYGKTLKITTGMNCDEFVIGLDRSGGTISPVNSPEDCLNSPSGHKLQFWPCSEVSNPANTKFIVSPVGDGRIELMRDDSQCLNIPNMLPEDGMQMQAWPCRYHAAFLKIHAPINCEWGQWTRWTQCTPGSCDVAEASRTRTKPLTKVQGGMDCVGNSRQTQPCPGCSSWGMQATTTLSWDQKHVVLPTQTTSTETTTTTAGEGFDWWVFR